MVVVVGVGAQDHGDDGVGPEVVRLLTEAGIENCIDSGASPELDTWRVRELAPETVIFVDAVDFGGQPGEVSIFKANELRPGGFDTHRAPLRLTMEYLESEIGCKTRVVAIQPKDVRIGSQMCEEVRQSAKAVAEMLASLLRDSTNVTHPVIPNECEESAFSASEKADFSQARNDLLG